MYPKNLFERELHVKWPFEVVNTHYTILSYFFFKKCVSEQKQQKPSLCFLYVHGYQQQQSFSDNFPAHLP